MRRVYLVRSAPVSAAGLDADATASTVALRTAVPPGARWYAAPEPGAAETAAVLAVRQAEVVDLTAPEIVHDLLGRHPDEDLAFVAGAASLARVATVLTGRRYPELAEGLPSPGVVPVEMRPAGAGPPSLRAAALATVVVLCGELVVWQLGGRLGALSLAAAVIGIALTVTRRSRRWGATLLVGAGVGLVVAAMFVVAASPRTGG